MTSENLKNFHSTDFAIVGYRSHIDYGLAYVLDRTKLSKSNIYYSSHNQNRFITVDFRIDKRYKRSNSAGVISFYNNKIKALKSLDIQIEEN